MTSSIELTASSCAVAGLIKNKKLPAIAAAFIPKTSLVNFIT
jgi:hypothetical protein